MSSAKGSNSQKTPESGAGPQAVTRTQGGFLGGSGDARLVKRLLVNSQQQDEEESEPSVAKTSSLIDRLRNFLPQLEKANAVLQETGVESSGIDIIPGGMDSDDSEEEDDDDYDSGESEDGENSGPRIEMNISLFPVDDDDEEDEDDDDIHIPLPQKSLPTSSKASSKQGRVEELS